MAKICFMREGLTGRADPVVEKPLVWCIEKLRLQRKDWWADLETKFTIDKWLEISPYSRVRWVVIQLDETEASDNWKSGYYFSPLMKVEQVKKLIGMKSHIIAPAHKFLQEFFRVWSSFLDLVSRLWVGMGKNQQNG